MHVYILTRGIKERTDRFIENLCNQYLPFRFKGQNMSIQINVKPIQLYEIVFPKEHKDIMMRTLFSGTKGEPQHEKHKKWIKWIRRALGIDEISEYVKEGIKLPTANYHNDLEIMGVGEKEDREEYEKTEML